MNLLAAATSDFIVDFPGLGIEGLEIDRTAFRIGSLEIYWYGLLIALAVLLAMFLSLRQSEKYGIKQDDILDFFLITIPVGIIGARLYYVAFAWDEFKDSPLRIFDTRRGGLAFYGGVITGIICVWILARIKKIPFSRLAHFFIPYVPLGQAIGRWGNFFNQEAFGTNTVLPWGMYSNGTRDYLSRLGQAGLDPNSPVHPTFLYEFLGNMAIYYLLVNVRKKTKEAYEPLAWYLFLYGILRFFVEGIRTDSLYLGESDIRVSQVLSALMVLAGAGYLIYIRAAKERRSRRRELSGQLLRQPVTGRTETADTDAHEDFSTAGDNTPSDEDDISGADSESTDGDSAEFDMDKLVAEARRAADRALEQERLKQVNPRPDVGLSAEPPAAESAPAPDENNSSHSTDG